MPSRLRAFVLCWVCLASVARRRSPPLGYYRFPALAGDVLVFTAEGDLWKTTVNGGVPERLTAHPGEETDAGDLARRQVARLHRHLRGTRRGRTCCRSTAARPGASPGTAARRRRVGWTPDGKVLYATRRYSTLPDTQLIASTRSPARRRRCRWRRPATAPTTPTARSTSRACRSRAATQALPGRHGAEALAVHARRRRGRAADRRLRRHQQAAR